LLCSNSKAFNAEHAKKIRKVRKEKQNQALGSLCGLCGFSLRARRLKAFALTVTRNFFSRAWLRTAPSEMPCR
jgi:hypothetical protein